MAYEWIVAALEETWQSIDRLLSTQSEEAFLALTPCPGWTVKDVLSHLSGFELMLQGRPTPAFEGPWPDYVKNPIGELNEAFVAANRVRSGAAVLEEFRAITTQALAKLDELSLSDWEKVGWSPEGERPYYRFMETRVLDSWIHLQDIRDALLMPEDDHGPGEEIVLNRFEASLAYVVGKKMRAPDATTVQLNIIGHFARTVLLSVVDGRAAPVASLSTTPTLEITTPGALFWRRSAGRISASAFLGASATDVRGDRAMAQAFSEALAVMI